MFHAERLAHLRAEIKAAIKRGDMHMAWFLSGIVVLWPKEQASPNQQAH